MFTRLFLQTTGRNPPLTSITFWGQIVVSILFHTAAYTFFANMVSFIFLDHFLSVSINVRMMVCLMLFMFLGYITRMLHVQDVYSTLSGTRARAFIDAHYHSWVFIG